MMSNPKTVENVHRVDVPYVAHLARLHLTESEIKTFQDQLEHIVGYVRKIGELDLEGIEPTSHAVSVQNVLREDAVKPGLDVESVMRNAPASAGNQFIVPVIVE